MKAEITIANIIAMAIKLSMSYHDAIAIRLSLSYTFLLQMAEGKVAGDSDKTVDVLYNMFWQYNVVCTVKDDCVVAK